MQLLQKVVGIIILQKRRHIFCQLILFLCFCLSKLLLNVFFFFFFRQGISGIKRSLLGVFHRPFLVYLYLQFNPDFFLIRVAESFEPKICEK